MIKLYVLFQAAMQAHWRPLTCWHSLSWHRTCIPAVWTWTTPVLRWEQVKHPGDWGDCAVLHWCLFVIVPYVFVKWWFCVGCCAVLQYHGKCFYFKTNVPYNKIYCIILYRTKQHSIITHHTVSYSIMICKHRFFFYCLDMVCVLLFFSRMLTVLQAPVLKVFTLQSRHLQTGPPWVQVNREEQVVQSQGLFLFYLLMDFLLSRQTRERKHPCVWIHGPGRSGEFIFL